MRVLICEDSVLLREGVVRLLEHAGHEVVGALPDAARLFDAVAAHAPELCVLDVRLPPTFTDEGIRAAIELRRHYPTLPILVLSQYVEERYASELLTSGTGAIGYLLKDRVADIAEFLDAITRVAAGGTAFDPEVVSQLLARRRSDARIRRLSGREQTVLAALAEGRSNAAIAALLHLSEATVEKHISSIFTKLDLPPGDRANRRVLATLIHIEAAANTEGPRP